MEKFQKRHLSLACTKLSSPQCLFVFMLLKGGAYPFFNSFFLWLTYIITPPFQDFFSGQVFLFLWFALLLMFYDHDYLNFIAFVFASFKLSIIQAAMNIDYEQSLALDGRRKREEA